MKPQFEIDAPEPKAVKWFRIYCGVLAFLHVLYIPAGFFISRTLPKYPEVAQSPELMQTLPSLGLTIIVMGIAFGAGFMSTMFLPRKPASYGIALTSLLIATPCCFVIAVPVLLMWLKPEVKAYYKTQ